MATLTKEQVQLPAVQAVQKPSVSESIMGSYDAQAVDSHLAKWLMNARSVENNFFGVVVYALEQFQNKNNTPLTALVALTNGREWKGFKLPNGGTGVTQFKAPLKRILDATLSDATLTFNKGKAKWKVGHNGGVNADKLDLLRQLVADGLTAKAKKFGEMFPVVKSAAAVAKAELSEAVEKLMDKPEAELSEVEAKLVAEATEKKQEAERKYAKTVLAKLEAMGVSVEEFTGLLKSKDL